MYDLDFTTNACLEKTKAAVIGCERINIRIDFFVINVTTEEPEKSRLRFDLCE